MGSSFLNSEKAMLTFCCRQRSRLLVANIFLSAPIVVLARIRFSMSGVSMKPVLETGAKRYAAPLTLCKELGGALGLKNSFVRLFSIACELY